MGRSGVTYQEVEQVANKLIMDGEHPSIARVREVLGSGSNTTISEHLKLWRNERQRKSVNSIPDTIPDTLVSAFEDLWFKAVEQAENSLIPLQEKIKDKSSELDEARKRYEVKEATLYEQLESLKQQVTHHQIETQRAREESQKLRIEMMSYEAKNENLEAEVNQIKEEKADNRLKHLETVKDLGDQFEKDVQNLKDSATRVEEHFNQSEASLLRQLDDSRQMVKQLKKEESALIIALREEKAALNIKISAMHDEALERQGAIYEVNKQLDKLKRRQTKPIGKRINRRVNKQSSEIA